MLMSNIDTSVSDDKTMTKYVMVPRKKGRERTREREVREVKREKGNVEKKKYLKWNQSKDEKDMQ